LSAPERETGGAIGDLLGDEAAVDAFFRPNLPRPRPAPPPPARKSRPTHYKVVSISLYTDDLERLGELVERAKALGHTRANRSLLIREALRQLDLAKIPLPR